MLGFEWDEDKARRNVEKHGVSFGEAKAVFEDHLRLETIDVRHDYGEERIITIGMANGRIITVVYVMRGKTIRIISARRANKDEVDVYYAG